MDNNIHLIFINYIRGYWVINIELITIYWELIIFKTFPTDVELDTDFIITLGINNNKDSLVKAKPLSLKITNKAAKFNYNEKKFVILIL